MIRTSLTLGMALAASAVLLLPADVHAQRGGRGGPPPTPRALAPSDFSGYWVSVITEDWKFRMVTPRKGVYETLTLNAEGRKVGDAFDPARDEAAGDQCKAYGAANIMRLPGRLRVSWADDTTLKIETDAGTQTRLLRFGAGAPSGEPSWQGWSAAEWVNAGRRGDVRVGTLKVVTTNLRPGYIRKNGAPYSDKTKVTEYFDLNTAPNGDRWLTVTTKVEDPVYFTRPLLTSSDFKHLATADG
ncbi:MAG TPA: hypothetical protein VFO31_28050, partial [Vicinamibacterales bacterium]|nr:hypothetical protein [Vicinamibacterales bacterium]